MKTAMQEAINIIKERLKTLSIAQKTESVKGAIAGYQYSKYLLMELLEKEKEQIIDAVNYGNRQDHYDATEVELSNYYYNQTYNKNK